MIALGTLKYTSSAAMAWDANVPTRNPGILAARSLLTAPGASATACHHRFMRLLCEAVRNVCTG
jgi:hypothetical protein